MCERCVTVYDRLKVVVEELEKEFPGQAQDGSWMPACAHVAVALNDLATEWINKGATETMLHDLDIKDVA